MIKVIMIVLHGINAAPITIQGFSSLATCEAEAKRLDIPYETLSFKCVEVK